MVNFVSSFENWVDHLTVQGELSHLSLSGNKPLLQFCHFCRLFCVTVHNLNQIHHLFTSFFSTSRNKKNAITILLLLYNKCILYMYVTMHQYNQSFGGQIQSYYVGMYIRVGKTGSLGPWIRVIMYCRSVRMLPDIPLGIKNNW